MIKSKNYIDRISQYPQNKFSLIIMDEIFSSTNYIEGASGAYGILKKLSSFDNNMTLLQHIIQNFQNLKKQLIINLKIINLKLIAMIIMIYYIIINYNQVFLIKILLWNY